MRLLSQYYGKPFELVKLQGGRIATKVQPGGTATACEPGRKSASGFKLAAAAG